MNFWRVLLLAAWDLTHPGPQPGPQPGAQPGPQPQPKPPLVPPPPPPAPSAATGWTMLVCEPDGTIATVRNGVRTGLLIRGQSASWSLADGGIVYASAGQIWSADADGRYAYPVGDVGSLGAVMPQQAKSGRIVFMGDRGGAFLVNADGSALRTVLPGSMGAPGEPQYMQPTLSPDGTRMAFVKQTDAPYQRQVWSMDISTGVQRQETLRGGDLKRPDANAPMYMPNGDLVCFAGVEADQHPGSAPQSVFTLGQRDIALIPAISSALRRILTETTPVRSQAELEALSDGAFIMADNPSPSPDGASVIFDAMVWRSSERAVRAVTGIVNIDGTGQRVYYPHERGVVRVALR